MKRIDTYAMKRDPDRWVCLECETDTDAMTRTFTVAVMYRNDDGRFGPWMQTVRTTDDLAAWRDYKSLTSVGGEEAR